MSALAHRSLAMCLETLVRRPVVRTGLCPGYKHPSAVPTFEDRHAIAQRHIGWRTQNCPSDRYLLIIAFNASRQSEVHDHELLVLHEHDIGRFEIAMDDPCE